MGQRRCSAHGMSLMGELRSNAIGPWDLLDVSEEHEAAGRWTTVQTTGAREAEGKGENMTGQGLGKGGVGAALLHRASVWNLRKVGRPRACEWVTSYQAKLGLGSQVCRAEEMRGQRRLSDSRALDMHAGMGLMVDGLTLCRRRSVQPAGCCCLTD